MCVQVIEVFIRSEEGLSRDMVKHLNLIEEQVLESRAWSTDSALWSALQAAGNKIPTVEEVGRKHTLRETRTLTYKQLHVDAHILNKDYLLNCIESERKLLFY